ncbi:MAG: TIGR00730 family Rossman fold protein, partial [Thiogranum sp.]
MPGTGSPAAADDTPHFPRVIGETDEIVNRLVSLAGPLQNADLVREMVATALKAGRECLSRADLKLMNSTLKEMRYTAKVFGEYRGIRKVTVFGSARTPGDDPAYRMASELGRALAERGSMVITGGGPGIMQAANEGAGREHSFGVRIRLPFEAGANHVLENNPRLINYKYFFNRKVAFVKEADAAVLFPGGFGTLDEAMEILTLVQTGKRDPLPLILIEPQGGTYWSSKIDFMKRELLALG